MTNMIGLVDGVFIDQNSGINQKQTDVLYFGKHGDDANDGGSVDRAFLTLNAAMNAAVAGQTLICQDNGDYAATLLVYDDVNIYAPNASFTGEMQLGARSVVEFETINTLEGFPGIIINDLTSPTGYIKAKNLNIADNSYGVEAQNGYIDFSFETVVIGEGSYFNSPNYGGIYYGNLGHVIVGGLNPGSCVFGMHGGLKMVCNINFIEGIYSGTEDCVLFKGGNGIYSEAIVTLNHGNMGTLSDMDAFCDVTLMTTKFYSNNGNLGAGTVKVKPVAGALNYKGTWNCSGGVYPTPAVSGDYYICSVAGTISGQHYDVQDWLVYNGATWDKIDGGTLDHAQNTDTGTSALLWTAAQDVLVDRDATMGRDLTVLEDATVVGDTYLQGDTYFGSGYGSGGSLGYGATVDHDGSSEWQGTGNFTAGGIRIMEDAPPNETSVGSKGEITYGNDGGNWYLYVCVEDNTWRRTPLTI